MTKTHAVGVTDDVLTWIGWQVTWLSHSSAAHMYRITVVAAASSTPASCNRCHQQPPQPHASQPPHKPSLPFTEPSPRRYSNLRFCHSSAPNKIPIIATGELYVVLFSLRTLALKMSLSSPAPKQLQLLWQQNAYVAHLLLAHVIFSFICGFQYLSNS